MSLSKVGRQFLPKARRLIEESTELGREVTLLTRAASGHVVCGCGPILVETLVAPAVAEIVRQRSGLEIDVLTADWQEFPEHLRSGRLDFFVSNLALLREEADLECEPFSPQPVVWFARPGHPLAGKKQVSPAEFFKYPVAGPVVQAWMDEWFQQQAGGTAAKRYRFRITCSHYPALKEIVRHSDCVSGGSWALLAADFASGRLVPLDVRLPPLTLQAGLVTLRHRTLSPAARALFDAIKRHADDSARAQPAVPGPRHSRATSRKSGTSPVRRRAS